MADSNENNNTSRGRDEGSNEDPFTIEQAFALLQEGKEYEKEQNHWKAANKFVQGRQILYSLAKDQSHGSEEEKQIAQLYEQKADEYLHQSRDCLIEAMKREKESRKSENFYSDLSDEEASSRIRTFYTLFARKTENETTQAEENLVEQRWSIEERLQELNASLPSGFKTDEERMSSINRGLNRLGLSLYSQKKPFETFQDTLPKSEEEQIQEIMAQAKDEVAVQKSCGGDSSGVGIAKAEESSDSEESDCDDDENTEGDLALDGDEFSIKQIRQSVVKAQTKLAELVALLDEAKVAKQREYEEQDIAGDGSDSETENRDAGYYLSSGKGRLRSARRDLKKAMETWTGAIF